MDDRLSPEVSAPPRQSGQQEQIVERRGVRLGEWLAIGGLVVTLLGGAVAVARTMFADKIETATTATILGTTLTEHIKYQTEKEQRDEKAFEKFNEKLDRIETKVDRQGGRRREP